MCSRVCVIKNHEQREATNELRSRSKIASTLDKSLIDAGKTDPTQRDLQWVGGWPMEVDLKCKQIKHTHMNQRDCECTQNTHRHNDTQNKTQHTHTHKTTKERIQIGNANNVIHGHHGLLHCPGKQIDHAHLCAAACAFHINTRENVCSMP